MRWFVLLLIFCVCTPLVAQDPIPDTTEAWRYFPLEVGNVWEYRNFDHSIPSPNYLERETIQRDSVVGETRYSILGMVMYDIQGSILYSREYLVRFDSLTAQVVWLDGAEEEPFAPLDCPFDTPFPPEGEQLQCGPGPFDLVTGIGYDVSVQIGMDAVTTAVKQYAVSFVGSIRYAADLGYIGQSGCEGGCWDWRLTYANVSGIEYGEPDPVANEFEVPSAPSGISFSAYPNPSANQFSIGLSSSKLQQVAVEIFDLLGRRVYSEQRVIPAGTTQLQLDGSGWPRGLYLIRVTTEEGQTSTTGLTHQ